MDIPGAHEVENHDVDESPPSTFTSTAVGDGGSSSSTATSVDGFSSSVEWSSDSSELQFQMDDLGSDNGSPPIPQPDLVVIPEQQQPDLVVIPEQQPDLGSGGSDLIPDLGSVSPIPEADIKSQSPLMAAATDISIIPAVKQVASTFLNVLISSYNFQGPTTNEQHISNLSDGAIRHVYDYIVRAGPSLGIYPPPPPPAAAETETETATETETETGGLTVAVDGNGEAETGNEDYSSPSKKTKV